MIIERYLDILLFQNCFEIAATFFPLFRLDILTSWSSLIVVLKSNLSERKQFAIASGWFGPSLIYVIDDHYHYHRLSLVEIWSVWRFQSYWTLLFSLFVHLFLHNPPIWDTCGLKFHVIPLSNENSCNLFVSIWESLDVCSGNPHSIHKSLKTVDEAVYVKTLKNP